MSAGGRQRSLLMSLPLELVEGEVPREKRDNLALDAIGDVVDVVPVVDFELMGDTVAGQDAVELLRSVGNVGILVADIHADILQLTKVSYVLIDHVERFVGVEFGDDFFDKLAILNREIGEEWRMVGIGRPGDGDREQKPWKGFEGIGLFRRFCGFSFRAILEQERVGKLHAAGTEQIDAGENIGITHANANSSISPHGMPGETTAGAVGDRAVVGVDVWDELAHDVVFPVAGGSGVRIETALVSCERVRRDENHFAISWLRKRVVQDRGKLGPELGWPVPLLGALGPTMKEVNDGIATVAVHRITGWKIDRYVAVGGVLFQIVLERFAMKFDVLDRAREG